MKVFKILSVVFLILFSFFALPVVLSLSYLAYQNNSLYWPQYYFGGKRTGIRNLKTQNISSEGESLKIIQGNFENGYFEAYARIPQNPELIAVLYAGSRTGKEAMRYLKGTLENVLITSSFNRDEHNRCSSNGHPC